MSAICSGVAGELRHARMAGHDAFGKCFFQSIDRIALARRAKFGRIFERTFVTGADAMAARAVFLDQRLAMRNILRRCGCSQTSRQKPGQNKFVHPLILLPDHGPIRHQPVNICWTRA